MLPRSADRAIIAGEHSSARARGVCGRSTVDRGTKMVIRDLQELRTPDQVREAFRRYLRASGIKDTSARRKILDAVLALDEHFEAEQVLYLLRERGEKVGKATVYRTLPVLVDCGILKQVRFDVKQAHYEHAFGEGPHDHMVCRRCGRIVEFGSEEVVELRNRIARRHHFHVISHRLQLSGLCWECATACPVATMSPPPAPQTPPKRRRPRRVG